MTPCVFCAIAAHEASARVVYEDDDVVAFRDLHPKYPVHLLLIPKAHIASAAALADAHDRLAGKLLRIGARLAEEQGIAVSGYRLLTNTGPNAGQVVPHLHMHLMGGGPLNPL